jgi:hypothetical protein
MSRRIKAFLLAASVAGALPVVAQPANADWITRSCQWVAVNDPTDPEGTTWLEFTFSWFVGTPDVSQVEVTCWLQETEDLLTAPNDDTEVTDRTVSAGTPTGYTNPQPNMEIPLTRHTCDAAGPICVRQDPVVFQTEATIFYTCEHYIWTDGGTVADPFDLLDHIIRDVFSTGGVTTMGADPGPIVATITLAATNLVATLQAANAETHTEWLDWEPLDDPDADFREDGIQCVPSQST